jgi:chromosome segregation ATPase
MTGVDPSLEPDEGDTLPVADAADVPERASASWPRLVPNSDGEDDRGAMEQMGRDLEDAHAEVARLAPFEQELQRVEALEDRITELQQALLLREQEIAELQEKLDTESARSYRLSQRRIPALNKEIETLTGQVREFERKLQKSELKLATVEERNLDLLAQTSGLQRDLQDARDSMRQTAVLRRADNNELADQLRRRLQSSETERLRLTETLQSIGDRNKALIEDVVARAERLEQEGDRHHEALLAARRELKVRGERLAAIAKLADDLGGQNPGKTSPLLEAIRKLCEE